LPTAVETLRNGAEGLRTSWDKANEEGGWVADLRKSYNLDQFLTPEKLKEYSTTVSDTLVKQLFTIVGGLVGMLVQFVFLIFTIFFLFRDRDKIASLVPDFLPLERDQSAALTARTKEVVHACVYGVLFVASVQGLLGGIIFWLLGMSSPVVWGVVMTLLCTLPIVGAWVVWMPAAIGLALHGDYTKAVVLLLLGQFVISSIDGVIRPIVVGQRAKLHELLIFFSVLGGLRYFGIIGILIGPVVMAITYVLINSLWRVQKRREGEPQIIPG
jgi:predicted PurR-regulated permease PerM